MNFACPLRPNQSNPQPAAASRSSRLVAAALVGLFVFIMGSSVTLATVVVGTIQDVTFQSYGGVNNTLTFTPLSCPQAVTVGTNRLTIWDVPRPARLTNGSFRVNLAGGIYYAALTAPNPFGGPVRTVKILVPPNDTNVWQFNDCANLATNLGTFVWTNRLVYTVTNIINVSTNGFTGTVTNTSIIDSGVVAYQVAGGGFYQGYQNGIYRRIAPRVFKEDGVSSVLFYGADGWAIGNTTNCFIGSLQCAPDYYCPTNSATPEGLTFSPYNSDAPAPSVTAIPGTIVTNVNLTVFSNGLCVTNILQ